MRRMLTTFLCLTAFAVNAQQDEQAAQFSFTSFSDSIYTEKPGSANGSIIQHQFLHFNLESMLQARQPASKILGYSKKNKPIPLFYFPGSSNKKALIIGGVHGSELSAIELANKLVALLAKNEMPYYSVIIVPTLFPDNATLAKQFKGNRLVKNTGRYTHAKAIDPNRQMPELGKPFNATTLLDAYGRVIEKENILLLQLLQAYAPQRVINLHAIKDHAKAGVYADPRTDCNGKALGFTTDSLLAIKMAGYIDKNGGNAFGNGVDHAPTALYYLDPPVVPAGEEQKRNLSGLNMMGKIKGVSLGSWAATAVCDDATNYSRPAMRIITIEFPGYKKIAEYTTKYDRLWFSKQVDLYSASIYHVFLQAVCEEMPPAEKGLAIK